MRLKPIPLILITLVLSLPIGFVGCATSQDLRDRADQLEAAADRIEQVMANNPPDQVEDSVLAQAIIDRLPANWQATGRDVLNSVGDVREGAALINAKLNEAAVKLDQQADLEASEAENTFFAGLTLAETLIGTNGIIAGLAGIFWKKKKDADARARENEAIAEDIVSSIQSSTVMRKAIDEGGGADLRKSMLPSTQKAVAKIKKTIT